MFGARWRLGNMNCNAPGLRLTGNLRCIVVPISATAIFLKFLYCRFSIKALHPRKKKKKNTMFLMRYKCCINQGKTTYNSYIQLSPSITMLLICSLLGVNVWRCMNPKVGHGRKSMLPQQTFPDLKKKNPENKWDSTMD